MSENTNEKAVETKTTESKTAKKRMDKEAIKKMTTLALLVAIIVVLQAIAPMIKLPVNISFALIPITVGAILLGPAGGAILGATFGIMTIINALIGADLFTKGLMSVSFSAALFTVLLCLVKATAAGFLAGVVYKLLRNKTLIGATFVAAATAPIVNTGIFILGGLTVLSDAIVKAGFLGASGQSMAHFLIIGCAGINFIAEFGVNMLFATAIKTIVDAVQKATSKKV